MKQYNKTDIQQRISVILYIIGFGMMFISENITINRFGIFFLGFAMGFSAWETWSSLKNKS